MAHTQPDGYLASPASGGGAPVLVLHAWWGLNDTIKGICDRLAEAGYLAFAPDLYHGEVADTIEGAEALAKGLDENKAQADIVESIRFLNEQAQGSSPGLAVIGFSLGAYFALELSNDQPEQIRSVIVFYGTGPDEFNKSQAAYLGHFAENDPYEEAEFVAALEQSLKAAGRPVSFHTYPGTSHWFFEPDRADAYNEAAAKLAWERTLEFLKENRGS